MAKILRLHTGASNTIDDWGNSVKIGSMAIDSIEDPIGAIDKKEITSIPSPFARIDLVKNAFRIVSEGKLDGQTIYHKLVSDSLDVGQIFYNIEKYRDRIEIIVWDKNNSVNELNQSSYEEHKRLGKTLNTFLIQDSGVYHFNLMDSIYLLNFKAPSAPFEMNIIGATSPATLFFTSANDLSFVGNGPDGIRFGNDKPFDSDYVPLYKREDGYIKYWWSLKLGIPNFAALYPEVNDYLQKCYQHFSPQLRQELQLITISTYQNEYDDISVLPTSQNFVTILGEKLKHKRNVIKVESDFEMRLSSSLSNPTVKIPLVLPVDTYTERSKYVVDVWDKDTRVPFYDSTPIQDRVLPDDGSKYPYVTIGDFLEDTIVRIPYRFNNSSFFDGNDENPNAGDSYLLPLKKTFFNYFQASDLIEKRVGNGKKMIEVTRLAGDTGVKVILRIPVKAGFIQYQRIYYKGDNYDRASNKGVIIEREFTLGLYPPIKYSEEVTPFYRVSVLDRDSVSTGIDNRYVLKFFDNKNTEVVVDSCVERNKNSNGSRFNGDQVDSATYVLSKAYQYISVIDDSENGFNAVVIPKFVMKTGNHKFRFAIDFGTTNTHIEYSVDDESTRAFTIDEADMQIQKLHHTDDVYLASVFNSDFIPDTIGRDSAFRYPMRTVLSESNNTNWSRFVFAMAHTNIPYTYEKSIPLSYNVLHTDLKWSTSVDDRLRAEKYIESLMIMLRNKVLLNNGDLSKTEVVWFYPASMTQSRFNKFKDVWEDTFKKYFNAPEKNIVTISESVAPYYYHKAKKGATSTVVSIDIGGGTTDVLIVDSGTPKSLTSFRFAANAIFGDGYSYDADSNGFVKEYYPKILQLLDENNLRALKDVLKSLMEKRVSTDTIAFFFSLASNNDVNKQVEIDFNKMLSYDQRGKYVIILFYVAIMYHIATIMKSKGFDMPRHITFSGNGSKILNILSRNNTTMEEFTKLIFERIYERKYSTDGLTIIRPENSKESTCKGGIELKDFKSEDYSQIKEMKTVLIGEDSSSFVTDGMTYADINDGILSRVVQTVRDFIDFTFSLNKDFSFYDNFDVDRNLLNKIKEECQKDIKNYLDSGLSNKRQVVQQEGADDNIEESLFFYPLVGILNAISRKVYYL